MQALSFVTLLCRDAQLSSVLDSGGGTPAALAVLYMEVARRLGSPMVYPTTYPPTYPPTLCRVSQLLCCKFAVNVTFFQFSI